MKKHLSHVVLGLGLIIGSSTMVNAQWITTNLPGNASGKALATIGNNVFCGSGHGTFLSVANGSWTAIAGGIDGLLNSINAFAVNGNTIFVAGDASINGHAVIYRSTDNGTTWTEADTGTTGGKAYSLAISGTTLIAGCESGKVFLSTNNGKSWTSISTGLPSGKNMVSVAIFGGTFLASGNGGGIYRSTTNGASWSIVTPTQYPPINDFVQVGSTIYAGTEGGGVVVSTDDGTSWTGASTGLTNLRVMSLVTKGNTIYAGTCGGVFASTNGTSWSSIGLTEPAMIISSLTVNDTYIYAGTDYLTQTPVTVGVYRRPLSEIVSVRPESKQKMTSQVALNVRSSNLAKSEMTIEFTLPCSERVTVSIYNLLGNNVATMVNKNLGAGAHSVNWNTTDLPIGCYTIQFQAGTVSVAKSVQIMR